MLSEMMACFFGPSSAPPKAGAAPAAARESRRRLRRESPSARLMAGCWRPELGAWAVPLRDLRDLPLSAGGTRGRGPGALAEQVWRANETVLSLGERLHTLESADEAMQWTVDHLQRVLGVPWAGYVDWSGGEAAWKASAGLWGGVAAGQPAAGGPRLRDACFGGEVAMCFPDLPRAGRRGDRPAAFPGVGALACPEGGCLVALPVLVCGKGQGVLFVASPRRALAPEELKVALGMASLLSMSLVTIGMLNHAVDMALQSVLEKQQREELLYEMMPQQVVNTFAGKWAARSRSHAIDLTNLRQRLGYAGRGGDGDGSRGGSGGAAEEALCASSSLAASRAPPAPRGTAPRDTGSARESRVAFSHGSLGASNAGYATGPQPGPLPRDEPSRHGFAPAGRGRLTNPRSSVPEVQRQSLDAGPLAPLDSISPVQSRGVPRHTKTFPGPEATGCGCPPSEGMRSRTDGRLSMPGGGTSTEGAADFPGREALEARFQKRTGASNRHIFVRSSAEELPGADGPAARELSLFGKRPDLEGSLPRQTMAEARSRSNSMLLQGSRGRQDSGWAPTTTLATDARGPGSGAPPTGNGAELPAVSPRRLTGAQPRNASRLSKAGVRPPRTPDATPSTPGTQEGPERGAPAELHLSPASAAMVRWGSLGGLGRGSVGSSGQGAGPLAGVTRSERSAAAGLLVSAIRERSLAEGTDALRTIGRLVGGRGAPRAEGAARAETPRPASRLAPEGPPRAPPEGPPLPGAPVRAKSIGRPARLACPAAPRWPPTSSSAFTGGTPTVSPGDRRAGGFGELFGASRAESFLERVTDLVDKPANGRGDGRLQRRLMAASTSRRQLSTLHQLAESQVGQGAVHGARHRRVRSSASAGAAATPLGRAPGRDAAEAGPPQAAGPGADRAPGDGAAATCGGEAGGGGVGASGPSAGGSSGASVPALPFGALGHLIRSLSVGVDPQEVSRAVPFRQWSLHDGALYAEHHPEVVVLFSDIRGFTSMSQECPPGEVMAMLDALYQMFDLLVEAHGLYKVETIGDAYMVAGGLLGEPCAPLLVLALAQDMLTATQELLMPNGRPLTIRIGMHIGPAMSGVVGTKMPRYCLFGDTINTASRMESTGIAGAIQISGDLMDVLRDQYPSHVSSLAFEPTGGVECKGKGTVETYILSVPTQEQYAPEVLDLLSNLMWELEADDDDDEDGAPRAPAPPAGSGDPALPPA